MVDAAPFRAVRYDPHVAGDPGSTSAPAYDDVDPHAYAQHRTASPYTVLELLAGGAAAETGGYGGAAAALERWRRTGVLVTDPQPAYYLYEVHELRGGIPSLQRGILAAVAVTPPDGAEILPHEDVDAARLDDRLERLSAVPIDVSPVFGIYQGADDALAAVLADRPRTRPVVRATDGDGTDHRVWALRDPASIAAIRDGLAGTQVVIADGHHRHATAAAFATRLGGTVDGEVPAWGRTLMYLVDVRTHGPRVQAIHRLVEDLPADAAARLAPLVSRSLAPENPEAHARAVAERTDGTIGFIPHDGPPALLHLRDRAGLAARLPPGRSARWRDLDAALVDHALLPALAPGSVTPAADPVAGAARVRARPGAALVLLPPVGARTVIELALAGERMPPKSTSFLPKPRTGLILRDVLPPSRTLGSTRVTDEGAHLDQGAPDWH